ncbi:DUF6058 family natural product biosynthesis protein [Streptomyces albogriseolus]|nr:DUF6058 family natural product biosynthesis protein [Streptomyces albogriseolus]
MDLLEAWFTAHWDDPVAGKAEWDPYLSGQYVCLHSVTPATIRRKDQLTAAIGAAMDEPDAGSVRWSERLHALVDELDALEPAFTPYDRLRFGGPTSRDTCIDAVRARFPRPDHSGRRHRVSARAYDHATRSDLRPADPLETTA